MIKKKEKIFISVIGGDKEASPDALKNAEEVGKLIAKAGAVLICGGLKGVMEAVARGAKSENGLTIGILPGGKREEANPYIDIPIVTGLGYARNKLVVKSSQVVIAVDGKYGTLSEIAFALGYGIPIVGLNTWQLINSEGKVDQTINYVRTPEEAVKTALELAKEAYKPRSREKGI
ncbi:MAG: TIGR00725 family protein [Candidatus Margulisbacteria bacterium]|nr:TIGR00725 family protein [Candidatus Margulisiibacteriota bacterium]